MKNPYPHTLDNKRYQTWNYYLRKRFNSKVYKVPLSLAVTCPNRDGSKATGGCTFCLAGGGGSAYVKGSLKDQFLISQKPMENKWPDSFVMPYFQSFSNTYVDPADLQSALNEALEFPKVIGICIATRPDCLPDEVLSILHTVSKQTFLMVELGLQTIHDNTGALLNRGHNYSEFLKGYHSLNNLGIPVCIHIINGLPHEDSEMMLETAKEVAKLNPHSVKIHMLHILKGTKLEEQYNEKPFHLLTKEDYVKIVCDQLEVLPPETVVQRVTGDPPKEYLTAPEWTLNKLWVRNAIDKELKIRNSYQGIKYAKK